MLERSQYVQAISFMRALSSTFGIRGAILKMISFCSGVRSVGVHDLLSTKMIDVGNGFSHSTGLKSTLHISLITSTTFFSKGVQSSDLRRFSNCSLKSFKLFEEALLMGVSHHSDFSST